MNKLGDTISYIRKSRNLRQGVLAESVGITQTYMSMIEKNKKEPNLSLLKKIADVLQIPYQFLILLTLEIEDLPPQKQEIGKEILPMFKSSMINLLLNDQVT